LTVITVAFDSAGPATAGEWIRAASPTHPSLIDTHHEVARAYNMVNVPTAAWIDEEGRIVRPNEVAFADNRWIEYTKFDMTRYLAAIRDWVDHGPRSGHVLPPAERLRRLSLPSAAHALAAATFRLAEHLHESGRPEAAVPFFKRAQELQPEVVLLDVHLPDFDGFEVAERLRELEPAPIVILTSSRDDYGSLVGASSARAFLRKDELSGAALSSALAAT